MPFRRVSAGRERDGTISKSHYKNVIPHAEVLQFCNGCASAGDGLRESGFSARRAPTFFLGVSEGARSAARGGIGKFSFWHTICFSGKRVFRNESRYRFSTSFLETRGGTAKWGIAAESAPLTRSPRIPRSFRATSRSGSPTSSESTSLTRRRSNGIFRTRSPKSFWRRSTTADRSIRQSPTTSPTR